MLMRLCRVGLALTILGCLATPARGQTGVDTAYRPDTAEPRATELVALVISARSCGPCNRANYKDATRRMKILLARQAAQRGESFAVVGIGIDWNVDTARAYFATLGQFDELVLGRNWRNTGALAYMWRDSIARPAMPQVVLVRRHIDFPPGSSRMTVSPDSVLRRLVGASSIVAWVAQGAQIAGGPTLH